jgi:hypothetical protein
MCDKPRRQIHVIIMFKSPQTEQYHIQRMGRFLIDVSIIIRVDGQGFANGSFS